MCGIFGVFAGPNSSVSNSELRGVFEDLFLLSESRGKESSGVAFLLEEEIAVLKDAISAKEFVNKANYQKLLRQSEIRSEGFGLIGHSRLVTNGIGALNANNQPVVSGGDVMIHNGIVVNDKEIWQGLDESPSSMLDSEAMLRLYQRNRERTGNEIGALRATYQEIYGNTSVCIIGAESSTITLATNNGSIYYAYNQDKKVLVFASESYILNKVLLNSTELSGFVAINLRPNTALKVSFDCAKVNVFGLIESELEDDSSNSSALSSVKPGGLTPIDHSQSDYPNFDTLVRCSKCILPESFPGISFDSDGVCNKCRSYEPARLDDEQKLVDAVAKFRSSDGSPDCLVGLSGGRDSCYGLHVIKKELGLNPIAYTYDWGLVTDLARRNISRMCGKLGVEHILVSADIATKRRNVRKNINAWLKKPDISMIPLFMAGDKQFYYHAHLLRKQTGVDLFMFAAGNAYERTDFKIAFSGLSGDSGQGILTEISAFNKLKLAINYGLKFISNPSYINSSILDTLHAFYSSYLLTDDYYYLYYYHQWDEEIVNSTLFNEYGWEGAGDTSTTWRIGDGTAAFYNYIYYVVCGFTEHDTFRSNQVRAGALTREDALRMANEDNKPRWESLNWYASTIGFNLDEALVQIHKMPKMYKDSSNPDAVR